VTDREVGVVAIGVGPANLALAVRTSGKTEPLHCDLVLFGTGYNPRMPTLIRHLGTHIGLDEITVSRHYRVDLGDSTWGALYLQARCATTEQRNAQWHTSA
jgi:lysine/ornithine N-monooxygenase